VADLLWLARAQVQPITPRLPARSHGVPRVNDQRVASGIIRVMRNVLPWRDAPAEHGPHQTQYNRFVRWRRRGVFNRTSTGLAGRKGRPARLMTDATRLKARPTAASLLEKRLFPVGLGVAGEA
jgi:transposase